MPIQIVQTDNVNYAWRMMCRRFNNPGALIQEEITRNGKARVLQEPLVMEILRPNIRVLFCPFRNANPIFHLMESLWMLAGRNDLAFVRQFNKQMYTYSDDGKRLNAAYGFRWRNHFDVDQIEAVVEKIKENPRDRRTVISMWDANQDLCSGSKDLPCNTQIMFRVVQDSLVMSTTNRSNDLVWGLLGANCVHLTVLQELIATAVGLRVGKWYHFTNNLHVYEHHYELLAEVDEQEWDQTQYSEPAPIVQNWERFLKECEELCDGKLDYFEEPFFDDTVAPMIQSWLEYKKEDIDAAINLALCIQRLDWYHATVNWYRRRKYDRESNSSI